MFWLLTLNTLIEGATGLVLIVAPGVFYPTGDALVFSAARNFGVSACALAVLSGAMLRLPTASPAVRPGLVTLAVFHTCLVAALVPAVNRGFTPLPVAIIHSLLAVAFIAALLTHARRS